MASSRSTADLNRAVPAAIGAGQAETATENSQSASVSAAAYREGINLASSAYNLSQSAVSPDDWSLISARWQRAADHLKKVSASDKDYTTAQQKIPEYIQNAEYATSQLRALQESANAPLPTRSLAVASESRPISALPASGSSSAADKAGPAGITQPPKTSPFARTGVASTTATQPSLSHASTAENIAGGVQVPIARRMHGTPVVRVMFNEEQSYEMILDTGASRTLITRPMADKLGIVSTGRMTAATASANSVTFELGQMRSMSLGSVTLNDAQVSIGETTSIGLLGNDFLRGYDVTIRESTVELVAAR